MRRLKKQWVQVAGEQVAIARSESALLTWQSSAVLKPDVEINKTKTYIENRQLIVNQLSRPFHWSRQERCNSGRKGKITHHTSHRKIPIVGSKENVLYLLPTYVNIIIRLAPLQTQSNTILSYSYNNNNIKLPSLLTHDQVALFFFFLYSSVNKLWAILHTKTKKMVFSETYRAGLRR